MVRQSAKVIALEVFGTVFLLAMIALAVLVVALASGPVSLSMFRDDIERTMSRARGAPVEVGSLDLIWSPEEYRLKLSATDVTLFDDAGMVAAEARRAEFDLDSSALVVGKIRIESVELIEGAVRIVHLGGDDWRVAGERVSLVIPTADTFDLRQITARAGSFSDSLMAAINVEDGVELFDISITDFGIDLIDANGSQIARIPELDGSLRQGDGETFLLDVSARSDGEGLPRALTMRLESDADRRALEFELSLADWSLEALMARIMPSAPNAPTAISDQPVEGLAMSAGIRLSAERDTGITSLSVNADLGDGILPLPGNPFPITAASGELQLNVVDETLVLRLDNIESQPVTGALTLVLDNAFEPMGSAPLSGRLTASRLTFGAVQAVDPGFFLRDIRAEGVADFEAGAVSLDALGFALKGQSMDGAIDLRWKGEDLSTSALPVAVSGELRFADPLGPEDLLALWPDSVLSDPRATLETSFLAGTLDDVAVTFDLSPATFGPDGASDEAYTIDYILNSVDYRVIAGVAPLREVIGRGQIRGNSMWVSLTSGKLSTWEVGPGQLEVDRFRPEGGQVVVTGEASGPIADIMREIRVVRPPEPGPDGQILDLETISGEASVEFEVSRPLGEGFDPDTVVYQVVGSVRECGLRDAVGGYDFTDISASLDINNARGISSGLGRLAGTPVQFTITDRFHPDRPTESRIEARTALTPNVMNALGLTTRAFFTGEAPVEMTAIGVGGQFDTIEAEVDFTPARLAVSEIGLLKSFGEPASGRFTFRGSVPGRPAAFDARFGSATAEFDAEVQMTFDDKVDTITLRRVYVDGQMDVAGKIERDPLTGIRMTLSGPYLDMSNVFGGVDGFGSAGETLSGDLSLDAQVGRLTLGSGLEVIDATLDATVQEGRTVALSAQGKTSGDRAFSASLSAREDGRRNVQVSSEDAEFLFRALFGAEFLTGGRLELEGILGSDTTGPSELQLDLFDVRLEDAPLLTQILSLASIRGVADTLSGDGVLFTEVSMPVTISGPRFIIDGGRASGPALGVTVNGWVEPGEGGGIEQGGVLVPSFGVNSALGGVPIIGDLFVSREGEGVFSLTYGVSGTLERAQVSINPLSAITPGVLRRIFENPSDTDVEALASENDPTAPEN